MENYGKPGHSGSKGMADKAYTLNIKIKDTFYYR